MSSTSKERSAASKKGWETRIANAKAARLTEIANKAVATRRAKAAAKKRSRRVAALKAAATRRLRATLK